MSYAFHVMPPHMDDLLDLNNSNLVCVKEAHKLPNRVDKLLHLRYVFGDGVEHYRYSESGHIYAVAGLLCAVFTVNKAAYCKNMHGEAVDIVPANVANIPQMFYRALFMLNRQISAILRDIYAKPALSLSKWPGGDDGSSLPWEKLTDQQEWELVDSATREMALTYDRLAECFLHDELFRTKIGKTQYALRFLPITNPMFKNLTPNNNIKNLDLVFEFLLAFSTLLNDVALVLRGGLRLTLTELEQIPSRHSVLRQIVDYAPNDSELTSHVFTTLLSLPEGQRECSICLKSWINGVEASLIEIYKRAVPHEKWPRWIKEAHKTLIIRPGYEGVPLKMRCGHIFCAGCIKTWLDNAGRLQCPIRDADYGIHRVLEVRKVEALRDVYRKNCGLRENENKNDDWEDVEDEDENAKA